MSARATSPVRGFTLLELLVVVGLIALLAAGFAVAVSGGSRAIALESGQGLLANFVSSARTRAISSGRPVRVLVRNHPAREDYRRLLVLLQLRTVGADEALAGNWEVSGAVTLPRGVYLLPDAGQFPAGLLDDPAGWVGRSGAALRSTLLANTTFSFDYDGQTEAWEYFGFTEYGTNAVSSGDLVLATGRILAPDPARSGAAVELSNPDAVRGLTLSNYGVARLVHDRHGF